MKQTKLILPSLVHKMVSLNAQATAWPGTVVSTAVYDFDYGDLGQLVGELYSFWEVLSEDMHWGPDRSFDFDDYDYSNGFEEFVCTLVEHWMDRMWLQDSRRGMVVGRWSQPKLQQLDDLLSTAKTQYELHELVPQAWAIGHGE